MGGAGGAPKGDWRPPSTATSAVSTILRTEFTKAGDARFGSGWVCLTVAKGGKLALVTKPNQDTPIMEGQRALFGTTCGNTPTI